MIKNYFITAWRSLWRNKTVTFINLLGLSVGMAAAVLILMWVQNEKSFDTYHPYAKNIYRIVNHLRISKSEKWDWENSPLDLAVTAKQDIPEIELTTRLQQSRFEEPVLNVNNKLFAEKQCGYIDSNWFDMFHYDLKQGNFASFLKDPYGMVLTESKAKKFFGDETAIGQIIKIDSVNFTVKAVVKDNPANSSFQCDVLMPLNVTINNHRKNGDHINWDFFNYVTFIKLKETANINTVTGKINELYTKRETSGNGRTPTTASILSLASMHFDTSLQSSVFSHVENKSIYIFSILALLLLVTACINYVNLTTAKASLRAKEVSIRKIAGARSQHLFSQFIVESVLISLLSLVVSILLIQLSLPFFRQLTERNFISPFNSLMVWKVLTGTLLTVIVLNGIYPALLLSSFKPLNVFRGVTVLQVKDSGLRKGLVIFQFTLSVMLITGTIVVMKQMQFVQTSNPGYNRSQIISVQVPFKKFQTFWKNGQSETLISNMKSELSSRVNTQLVTSASSPVVDIHNKQGGSMNWEGRDSLNSHSVTILSADAQYKDFFKLDMKEGRWYLPNSKEDAKNYILNETAVRQLNIHQPVIGQRFSLNGVDGIVIGVVKDFHHSSMHSKIEPVLIYNDPGWQPYIFVKAQEGNTKQTLATIETIWHKFLPDEPFDYTFMDDTFNALYRSDLKTSKLIFVFSTITIIISALGLFGLAAFTAERKTKEIGIRKILGATVTSIMALLSEEFLVLVGIAIAIASPVAWWVMNRWLEDFAYRITISWWMFALAGFTALLIALVTVSFQAVKAAIANPVKSLRTE
jgi:ABC-type antimicrobial peptide transport system permease subunit